KLMSERANPKEELFDDYVRAWYLNKQKGWGWADIARRLFGDGHKPCADKAKRYAMCGRLIDMGHPESMRGERTPGVNPEWDKRKEQSRVKFCSKLRK